jgi:hypothetical protein
MKKHLRNDKVSVEIKRHWGDIEVVDATKDLRVFVQPEDISSAVEKDPGCCVFAQACKRQFAATKVLFWKSVAYVELPGPDGKRRVERFTLSSQMRSLIEDFDKGKPVIPEAGFELKRVRNSERFEAREEKRRKAKERKKHALLSGTCTGERKGNQGKGAFSKPAMVVDLEVRNGQGRVQFKKPVAIEGPTD